MIVVVVLVVAALVVVVVPGVVLGLPVHGLVYGLPDGVLAAACFRRHGHAVAANAGPASGRIRQAELITVAAVKPSRHRAPRPDPHPAGRLAPSP